MFFARSDWLLKLGIASAIHLPVFFWIRARDFPHFSEKKELSGVGYPLVSYILKQLFTSVSAKSGRYLPLLRDIIVNYRISGAHGLLRIPNSSPACATRVASL